MDKFFVKQHGEGDEMQYAICHETDEIGCETPVHRSLAQEFQRLQKIEWCVKEQGIDLTRPMREFGKDISYTMEVIGKVTNGVQIILAKESIDYAQVANAVAYGLAALKNAGYIITRIEGGKP